MKTKDGKQLGWGGKAGSAFLMAMFVASVLLFAGLVMATISGQMQYSAQRGHQSAQALDAAEAGIADMMAKLSSDYLTWQNGSFSATMGSLSYQVNSVRNVTDGCVKITSTGTCDSVSRWTMVTLLGTVEDRNDSLWTAADGVLSGGNTYYRTAAYTINGNSHANGNVESENGAQNGTITGQISAHGQIGNAAQANTNRVAGAAIKEIPAFNFDSYRTLAQAGGLYYGASMNFNGQNLVPANGIVYVNGNCTFANQSSVRGTLVVNGDTTLGNKFTQTAFPGVTNAPSILVKGNLFIQNKTTFAGMIYATGDIKVSNNSDFNGGIVAIGNIQIENNCTVNKSAIKPNFDPLVPQVPPKVIMGAWVK